MAAQQEVTDKTNNLNNLQSQFDTLQTDYNAAKCLMLLSQKQSAINSKTISNKLKVQANNDLQFAQTELTNLQGQLDAIPAQSWLVRVLRSIHHH